MPVRRGNLSCGTKTVYVKEHEPYGLESALRRRTNGQDCQDMSSRVSTDWDALLVALRRCLVSYGHVQWGLCPYAITSIWTRLQVA
jgi:hypothetical protein